MQQAGQRLGLLLRRRDEAQGGEASAVVGLTTTIGRVLVGRLLDGRGVEALAIADGSIVAVGPERELRARAPAARCLGSGGAWLVPGFVDAHLHLLALARRRLEVDCSIERCGSLDAVLAALRDAAVRCPVGTWIRAFGIDDALLPEHRLPTREELDIALPSHPLRLLHRTGHAAVLNREGLRRAGVADEGKGGLLFEPAATLAGKVPAASGEALERALDAVSLELASRGVTTLHDPTPGAGRAKIAVLAAERREGRVRQRLRFYGAEEALGVAFDADPEIARVAGVKLVASDGGDAAALAAEVAALDRRGISLAIHAVEGEALVATVAALAGLGPERVRSRRHRIEHAGLVPPPLVDEIAHLGATVVTHPLFAEVFAEKYRASVPPERRAWLYPMASWRAAGVVLAFGSDAPIAPSHPLRQIAAGVARGLPAAAGFVAHTRGGARAAFDENRLGTLEVGRAADVVVLEGDPLGDPAGARVAATLVAGETVFER